MTSKILFVGDLEFQHPKVLDWLLDPLRLYKNKIERNTNCVLRIEDCKNFDQVDSALERNQPDILFYSCLWNTSVIDVKKYLKKLRSTKPDLKIIFFDHYDQSSSPFFKLLDEVDLYVKMKLFKDLNLYKEDYEGGYIFTDYMHKHSFLELGDWNFGSKVSHNQLDKLMVGWNLSSMNSLSRYSRYPLLSLRSRLSKKTNDIVCRLSISGGDENTSYYSKHRSMCLNELVKFKNKRRVIENIDGSKVSFSEFNNEIRKSHLAISPFGWGEMTDRDFRIINHRTLLVKPDMSHLTTEPDIYVNGETYVPVEWDFSNLEEVCEYYLNHPKETKEIIENAARVLADFYKNYGVVDRFNRIVDRVLTI